MLSGIPSQASAFLHFFNVGVCSAIVNVGIGFMLVFITIFLSEVVDYGEYKLGTRNESILPSM